MHARLKRSDTCRKELKVRRCKLLKNTMIPKVKEHRIDLHLFTHSDWSKQYQVASGVLLRLHFLIWVNNILPFSAETTNISIETESQRFTFQWNDSTVLIIDVNNYAKSFNIVILDVTIVFFFQIIIFEEKTSKEMNLFVWAWFKIHALYFDYACWFISKKEERIQTRGQPQHHFIRSVTQYMFCSNYTLKKRTSWYHARIVRYVGMFM